MNIKLALIPLLFLQFAYAQVQMNVMLHPIVNLEINEENIICKKQGRDFLIVLPLETFVAPAGEVLRFELIHLDGEKKYSIAYNDDKAERYLTREKPYTLVYPKRGTDLHRFTLKISDAPSSYCHRIKDTIRLSLEPM